MAITLTVLTIDGVEDTHGLSASFDALGGTIGRAAHNHLVLPDLQRRVSRVHAQLVYRGGAFAVIDQGSNPLLLNGKPAGRDREVPLRPGDRLRIGEYLLLATAGATGIGSESGLPPDDPDTDGGIPLDWDPFAAAVPATDAAAPGPTTAPDLAPGDADISLDALFGLPPSAAGRPDFFQDPVPPVPQAPSGGVAIDLLRPFAQAGDPAAETLRDDGSELHRAFLPSRPAPCPPPTGAEPRPTRPARPAAPPPLPGAAPAGPEPQSDAGATLLAALREGLDCDNLQLPALDPALMRLLGQLLRGSVQGILELLRSRQDLKRELHAELTAIGSRHNNPLKFSPDVDAALQQLLLPPRRGFLEPVASLHQACDDLRTHQQATVSGLRAVVADLMTQLSPETIVSSVPPASAWTRLRAGSHEAACWEAFRLSHRRLCEAHRGDGPGLFGDVFRRAYETQAATPAPRLLRHRPAAAAPDAALPATPRALSGSHAET